MIPCRSSIQRWQTTGLDSAFGIRLAETPRRGPPRPPPDEPSGETITPETVGGCGLDPFGRDGLSTGRKVRRARCLPACCEANRRRPAFPPFTSAFGPGLHLLSGGVGDGGTPVAVFPGGGMDGPRPGRPQRQRRARVRKGSRSPSGPHTLGLRRQGRRHRRRRAPRHPRHPRRSEGMSVRGRTMARGTAAFRREETCALGCRGYSAPAGEPAARPRAAGRSSGAAARGSVETGRDLRAGPAKGGGGRNGGEELQPGRGRRRKPVPGAKGGGGRARHRYRMRPRAETGIIQPTASRQSDRTAAGDRAAPGGTRAGPSRRPKSARTRFSGRRSAPGTGTAGADMGRNRSPRSPQLRIPSVNSRMVSRAGKKRFSVSKIMVTIRLFTPQISRPPVPPGPPGTPPIS